MTKNLPITPEQKQLVQSTFKKVAPIAEVAAEMFYAKLFEIDPKLKPMFKGDMKAQGKKLMTMLATAVKGLDNLEALVPAVRELGKRHVGYGVKAEHYNTVAAALLSTLETALKDDWNKQTKDAWTAVYLTLAGVMMSEA